MSYEWDENKRRRNIRDHGIDFPEAAQVFDGETVIMEDDRFAYGERRFRAYGLLGDRVIMVVYTERGQNIRIISARDAEKYEERRYYEEILN